MPSALPLLPFHALSPVPRITYLHHLHSAPAAPHTSTGRYTIELPAVSAALLVVRRVRDDQVAQEDGEQETDVE